MDSTRKTDSKNQNRTQNASYNPWNLLFNSRNRSESESSASSTNSDNCQSGESVVINCIIYLINKSVILF